MINLGFTHGSKISILYPDANFPVIKNCHLKLKMKKKKRRRPLKRKQLRTQNMFYFYLACGLHKPGYPEGENTTVTLQ